MGDNAIEVRGVSKRFKLYTERRDTLRERFVRGASKYQDFWALRNIDLDIPAGSTFGLVGHNGSGKSTLLKLLSGVHRPTSGTIVSHGRMSALLELGAGFHPELTGRENIYLNGAILGLSRKQINASIEEIIDFAAIDEFIDTPVKIYSSGMTVRLGFAIAVQVYPEILIVDEVIAVGDEEFQRKCMDRLFTLRRAGTTIVLVSHAMASLRQLCDNGAWLDHGQVMGAGPIGEIVSTYLASVNQREASTRANVAVGDAPSEAVLGSGEIRLTGVEYRNGLQESVQFAVSGEPLGIRLHYSVTSAVHDAEIRISVEHESGFVVATPPALGNLTFTPELGGGFVDFWVDSLILQPGDYSVSTSITTHGHRYDAHDHAADLRVRSGGGGAVDGLVRLDGQWRIPE